MAEYIERESIYKILLMENPFGWNNDDLAELFREAKAADVAPVRHGRWIDKGEYAVCTECGVRSGTQYDGVEPIPLMTQFCPNCGAKMDGGGNGAAD